MSSAEPGARDAFGPVESPPLLPEPRGELTAYLLDALTHRPHPLARPPDVAAADSVSDDDLQLALYVCYELHYRSFAEVDDGWEWEPTLLAWRRRLEAAFEVGLDLLVPSRTGPWPDDMGQALRAVLDRSDGPSLSSFMEHHGTLDQMREFAVHRSAYQLKEADPHTWGIPRLTGDAKAAFVQIQCEEYGNGSEAAMHSSLFSDALRALDLDARYGSYLDILPGPTLATVNLVSLFGLHRRWRGALVGHLATFEMTSVVPMARYSRTLDRLGVGAPGRRFYDVHVEADAEHEVIAVRRMAAGLARDCPDLAPDILFGAAAVAAVEGRFAKHLLDAWAGGRSSLLRPLPPTPSGHGAGSGPGLPDAAPSDEPIPA